MSDYDVQYNPQNQEYNGSISGSYHYDPAYSVESQSNLSTEEEIKSLKEKQIKAIQEMNFEEADNLQQKIFNLSDRQSNELIKQY